jgi:hypothetical protein
MLTQIAVLAYLIAMCPGRTEMELARAVHGRDGYQQQVNQDCSMLVNSGRAERRGNGGPNDPYRYFPKPNPLRRPL